MTLTRSTPPLKGILKTFTWIPLLASALLLLQSAYGLYHDKGYGEPYELAGKRMAFTTWYWVRPGQMDWQDDQGKSVFADRSVMAGPLDSHFINIDGPWGIRLFAEQAQRDRLTVEPQHPWEAQGITLDKLVQDGDKIRGWGSCRDEDGQDHACYLESEDGFSWNRPSLGLVEYRGSKDNNLTPGGPNGHVFIDPNGPPEERFKSVANSRFDPEQFKTYKQHHPWSVMATETDPGGVHAIFGYVSPDGFSWTKIEEPLSVEVSDGDQSVYWDAHLKKYVLYARSYFVGPRAEGYPLKHERRHQFIHRRAIGRTESADFRHFPLSEIVIETASDMGPTDTYYLNCRTTIPGVPDSHVMFPSRYILEEDTTAMDLYTSYDGRSWHLAPGSPLLRPSDFGNWDGGCVFTYPNLIERGNGDWMLLYRGDLFPHKYPRGLQASEWGIAVWPKGRLMGIEAKSKGAFTTPSFLAPGERMFINALTNRVGEIRVEVADFYGKTLPGHSFEDSIPILGDQYRAPIRWKGTDEIGVPIGEPLVLRFKMDRAKLYSLDFE